MNALVSIGICVGCRQHTVHRSLRTTNAVISFRAHMLRLIAFSSRSHRSQLVSFSATFKALTVEGSMGRTLDNINLGFCTPPLTLSHCRFVGAPMRGE